MVWKSERKEEKSPLKICLINDAEDVDKSFRVPRESCLWRWKTFIHLRMVLGSTLYFSQMLSIVPILKKCLVSICKTKKRPYES